MSGLKPPVKQQASFLNPRELRDELGKAAHHHPYGHSKNRFLEKRR